MSFSSNSSSVYTPPHDDALDAGDRHRALRTEAPSQSARFHLAQRPSPLASSHTATTVHGHSQSKSHHGSRASSHKPAAASSHGRSVAEENADGRQRPASDTNSGAPTDTYDYDDDSSTTSSSNSLFSDFSGESGYGSSLFQRQAGDGFPALDLSAVHARESQDHRSSLVTTADLEVAVVKYLLEKESDKSYLLARIEGFRRYVRTVDAEQRHQRQTPLERVADAQGVAAHRGSLFDRSTLLGTSRSAWLSDEPIASAELTCVKRRTDLMWQQHLDAFVECYLSDPVYRTALAQFHRHQTPAHQHLRLPDYRENYRLATSLIAQFQLAKIVTRVLHGDNSSANMTSELAESTRPGADAYGLGARQPDFEHAETDAIHGQPVYPTHHVRHSVGSASPRASTLEYSVQRWDVELFGTDTARRIRFKDDTLPWRPVNFASTTIRLEPIVPSGSGVDERGEPSARHSAEAYTRHSTSTEPSVADMSGLGHGASLVGGSINLLVEVLILTEVDAPFTFGVPRVNYTNVFMITASLFVLPDVLISKFIRLFRSIYYWKQYELFSAPPHAQAEAIRDGVSADHRRESVTLRASYLHRRILQCMLAYCRCHEMDLTMRVLQRMALFIEKCGFPSPLAAADPNRWGWTASRGVLDGVTLSRATAAAATPPASPGVSSPTVPTDANDFRSRALMSSTGHSPGTGGQPGGDTTRIPLGAFDEGVAHGFLELSIYVERFAHQHYRSFAAPTTQPSPKTDTPTGRVDVSPPRSPVHGPAATPGVMGRGAKARTTGAAGAAATVFQQPHVYLDRGQPRRHLGSTYVASRPDPTLVQQQQSLASGLSGVRDPGEGLRAFSPQLNVVTLPTPEEFFWVLRGNVDCGRGRGDSEEFGGRVGAMFRQKCEGRPVFRPTLLHAETFAQQLCVLSFSLFARIRVRELLNNAWQRTDMQASVAGHLNELICYGRKLTLWTTAVVTVSRKWEVCQRSFRHMLEICRRLYDQQNYEMASAVLNGLQHDAVARLSGLFKAAHGEPILTTAEQREMETLTELMNPYAAYSPSSLNSVTARTAGDMDSAILPLLSPILTVLSRAQESSRGNPAVVIREYDGQALVVWTKVMAIGKMVNLWLRCQVTPFPFRAEPALQEYLWSLANHQWTDDALVRVARREKH